MGFVFECRNRLRLRFLLIASLLVSMTPGALIGQSVIKGINWFPIGPADVSNGQDTSARINTSGRATVIAVNPKNPNELWLGTASGGVWHSTNAGVNFLPISDDQPSLAIGAIALDNCIASECGVIYAGTGENSIRRDTYYGMGLLIGQVSGPVEFRTFGWTLVGADIFKFASINNVVLDPTTSGGSKVIYLTLSSGETASATESTVTAPAPPQGYGIYKSTNGGSAWNKLTVPGATGSKPTDMVIDPANNLILYAGFLGRGIFKTSDGGSTWCPLNTGIALPPGCVAASGLPDPSATTFDAVRLAIFRPSGVNPAVLYAVLGNCPDPVGNGPVFGGYCSSPLYQSTNGGTSWTLANAAVPTGFSRYHQALTIDPSNSGTVYFGGLTLHKSTNNGNTFFDLGTSYLHPDHHALVFPDPTNLLRMYNASDGGFASSTDGGSTWSTAGNSDLQITGFQSMSWSPLTARIIGGTQDNGTEMWLGTRIWDHRDDGDSASTVMDLDNVMTMFDVYFNTPFDPSGYGVRRDLTGGTCCSWGTISNGVNTSDPTSVYSPVVEAAAAPHNLYFGTNRLYQSTTKGTSWAPVSPVLGGTSPSYPDIGTTNVITAIAVAPSNGNRIYIGYYDGQMFVTDGACTAAGCWTAIGGAAKGIPSAPITRIGVDPGNADVAYATVSGFSGGAHVFKTTNKGSVWTGLSNGLPSIPTNTITVENSTTLWVGTDDGVYQSTDSGGTWNRHGTGLPRVPVYEIALDAPRGRLYAGTHGRGTFILTTPFLTNFEGWVNNDIWDIPVYGTGFVGTIANPPGSACTMSLIQLNGAVCASSTTDAMGGTITFDMSGSLVTSKGTFYNGRPVAFGCFNGSCIGGKTIAQCNPAGNPLTSVTVTCGTQVGIDHILGCPQQGNPPSSVLGLSSMPSPGGGGGAPMQAPPPPAVPAMAFDVIPSVQARTGVQVLCNASVATQANDTPAAALLKTRDAVNSTVSCQQSSVQAVVRGIPPDPPRGEDLRASPPNLALRAPSVVGGQLFTAIHAPAGAATGACFDVAGLGSPLLNQVAVMKVDFETRSGGAAGGDVTVLERSSLGSCLTTLHTTAGESAAEIASALANSFQAPGLPGPPSCPAMQNPRDITPDGTSIVSVLASELRVCNSDPNVGFLIGPKELPNVKHRVLQYAAKFLCGEAEHKEREGHHDRGGRWPQVARGTYYTAINLHNPADKPALIRFKFAAALPNGKPGPISRFSEIRLGPDEAISINCTHVFELLQAKTEFLDGFVVIESDIELDAVAVYTAGEHGKVTTLHTERVPARLLQ